MKTCIACGMPMDTPGDFARSDPTKDFCRFCARPDGTMQSYEEKVESLGRYIARTQGLDEAASRRLAAKRLADLPAWKGR